VGGATTMPRARLKRATLLLARELPDAHARALAEAHPGVEREGGRVDRRDEGADLREAGAGRCGERVREADRPGAAPAQRARDAHGVDDRVLDVPVVRAGGEEEGGGPAGLVEPDGRAVEPEGAEGLADLLLVHREGVGDAVEGLVVEAAEGGGRDGVDPHARQPAAGELEIVGGAGDDDEVEDGLEAARGESEALRRVGGGGGHADGAGADLVPDRDEPIEEGRGGLPVGGEDGRPEELLAALDPAGGASDAPVAPRDDDLLPLPARAGVELALEVVRGPARPLAAERVLQSEERRQVLPFERAELDHHLSSYPG
jgi:hypothetical protein